MSEELQAVEHDALGRVSRVIDPLGRLTDFQYNGADQHQYIVAHSDNPADPTLIIDPNHDEIRQITQPTTTFRILIGAPEVYRVSKDGGIQQGEVTFGDAMRMFFGPPPPPLFH